jgi:hypothetical protein
VGLRGVLSGLVAIPFEQSEDAGMPSTRLSTALGADWHELTGHWTEQAVRRLVLTMLLAMALLLGAASVVHASSRFYWYGENSSTCWQTGSRVLRLLRVMVSVRAF